MGRRGTASRLTEAQIQELRARRIQGEPLGQLAVEFGISASHASRISRGEVCSAVDGPRAEGRRTKEDHEWYTVNALTGCWVWAGRINPAGYGVYATGHDHGFSQLAHRYFYETRIGPVPEGLEVDHLCRNRACVNPAHLEAVTPAENVRRSRTPRLTLPVVKEIRQLYLTGSWGQHQLAAKFGVSRAAIQAITANRNWVDPDYTPPVASMSQKTPRGNQPERYAKVQELMQTDQTRDWTMIELAKQLGENAWNLRPVLQQLANEELVQFTGDRRGRIYRVQSRGDNAG